MHIGETVYIDRLLLATPPTESNADNYDKLLPRAYGHFQALQVTEHTLTVDENGIENIVTNDRAATGLEPIEHLFRFKALYFPLNNNDD